MATNCTYTHLHPTFPLPTLSPNTNHAFTLHRSTYIISTPLYTIYIPSPFNQLHPSPYLHPIYTPPTPFITEYTLTPSLYTPPHHPCTHLNTITVHTSTPSLYTPQHHPYTHLNIIPVHMAAYLAAWDQDDLGKSVEYMSRTLTREKQTLHMSPAHGRGIKKGGSTHRCTQ